MPFSDALTDPGIAWLPASTVCDPGGKRTVEAPPETASPGMPGFGVAIAVLTLLAGTLTARRV